MHNLKQLKHHQTAIQLGIFRITVTILQMVTLINVEEI